MKDFSPCTLLDIETKYMTDSGIVCNCSGWLFSVVVSGVTASPVKFAFHNGFDSNAAVMFQGAVARYQLGFLPFDLPLYFSKGLYFLNVGNVDYITTQFLQEGQ